MEKPHIRVVAAEIEREGRYLITQRRPHATLPLLWEFPGGKVENGETDPEALRRELAEKLGLEVDVGEMSLFVTQAYEQYSLDFVVYRVVPRSEPRAVRVHDLRWVTPDEFEQYRFPGADQRTVEALLMDEAERE